MQTIEEIVFSAKTHSKWLRDHYFEKKKILPGPNENLQKHQLNALLLLSLDKPADLCRLCNSSILQLQWVMNNPRYKGFLVPKKKGGDRKIYAPNKELKSVQKRLNYFLQGYYLWIKPEEVHGFVVNPHYLGKHCNIVANAQPHTGKKYILNIDLEDFFPRIEAHLVKKLFISRFFAYSEQIANALALLTTYKGRLPIGAPTSPVISNFICYKLDLELKSYCEAKSLTYSRYADDLTFSSDTFISPKISSEIIGILGKHGFKINDKKFRMASKNSRQTVTGLTVNDKVNVEKKLLKRVRAMVHDLTKNGVVKATQNHFKITETDEKTVAFFIHRLEGYINFIGQVRGKTDMKYVRMKSAFDS